MDEIKIEKHELNKLMQCYKQYGYTEQIQVKRFDQHLLIAEDDYMLLLEGWHRAAAEDRD